MRIGNVAGRSAFIEDAGAIDINRASGGRFPSEMSALFECWSEFSDWANHRGNSIAPVPFEPSALGIPSPIPSQVFAIGLNYQDHAMGEAGLKELPREPAVFTKFPTSLAAPDSDLVLPSDNVDWEVELVVIIGRRVEQVSVEEALDYVAGYSVGQDYSERAVQLAGAMPQFSLGKSFPGFGPFGPYIVTLDEFDDPNDLAIKCVINGECVQESRTSNLIFSVGEIISRLSWVCPLLPGDVIFTGTPAGVGNARNPKIFLKPGDVVASTIDGVGTIRQRCIGASVEDKVYA